MKWQEVCEHKQLQDLPFKIELIKKDLYLEVQALEVWVCDEQGKMKFYNQQGELNHSLLVPEFPKEIKR